MSIFSLIAGQYSWSTTCILHVHGIIGCSSVFMDGNFVAKAYIPDVSPNEFFNCSLGVDPAVHVTYHPCRKTVSHQGGGLLSKTKTEISTFSQRISIKNTRPSPLEYLIVQDQVPVSEDEHVKVKVLNDLITLTACTLPFMCRHSSSSSIGLSTSFPSISFPTLGSVPSSWPGWTHSTAAQSWSLWRMLK